MKKKLLFVFSILFEVLLGGALVWLSAELIATVGKTDYSVVDVLSSVVLMLTALFGVYYMLEGCKKGIGSTLYVWFMGATAICDLFAISQATRFPAFGTVALAIGIASVAVLCFAKDLGQKKSIAFAVVALAAKLVILGITLASTKEFSVNIVTSALLSAVGLFMVLAKYYDKAIRHTK